MSSTKIAPDDPRYPSALAALAGAGAPPPSIWVRGSLPAAPGVAIVGTRRASEAARKFTRELAAALVAEGIAIWSGGAVGIDAAAHEGALAAGGITVLVAGGGLDRPYPAEHADLFARVLDRGGALVARVPDGTPPMRPWFLQRNEVLAAATQATVVIEAGFASGARSTAAAARRLGRVLCVVPQPPWEEQGAGCALELARGAQAVCSAADVLAAMGRPPPPPPPPRVRARAPRASRSKRGRADPSMPLPLPVDPVDPINPIDPVDPIDPLEPQEQAIFSALSGDPLHFDEVCERTGLAAPVVTGALLTLTLRSVVVEGPAGFFRWAGAPRS